LNGKRIWAKKEEEKKPVGTETNKGNWEELSFSLDFLFQLK